MTVFVSIMELEKELAALKPRLAAGERVVVMKDGEPVFDLAPHQGPVPPKKGLDYAAGRAHLAALGVNEPFPYVAPDFDEPLAEDFLIRPLPFD